MRILTDSAHDVRAESESIYPRNEIADVIRTRSKVFWTVGIFTAFINLLMLVPSIYMLQVYDQVLPSRNEITLLMLTLIMLGMFGMMSLLEYVQHGGDPYRQPAGYAAQYAHLYCGLRGEFKNGSSDAGQMLSDLTNVRQFLTGSALFAFFDAPWFPIYLLVIFLFNPWLGLFALVGSLLLIATAVINEMVSKKPLADASRLSIMSGNLASTNCNAEVIEALGMLPNLKGRWFSLHQRFLNSQRIASERASRVTSITKFVRLSLQSLVLGWGLAGDRWAHHAGHDDRRFHFDGAHVGAYRAGDQRLKAGAPPSWLTSAGAFVGAASAARYRHAAAAPGRGDFR